MKKALMIAMKLTNQKETSEVSLLLTDDQEIQKLNKKYRNIDAPTDVLSFSQIDASKCSLHPLCNDEYLLGDIVISVETAQRQADELGHSLLHEINLLLIHGFLHLIGYDHYSKNKTDQMKELEANIMINVLIEIKIDRDF